MLARIEMIAMTTSNSMSVNPDGRPVAAGAGVGRQDWALRRLMVGQAAGITPPALPSRQG
jgi:hypothetical protein